VSLCKIITTNETNETNNKINTQSDEVHKTNIIYNNVEYEVASTSDNSDKSTEIDSVASNYFSNLRTRSVIEPMAQYSKFPKLTSMPPKLEMDYSKILNKPYFVKNITWQASSTPGTLISTIRIPLDVNLNPLAIIPFHTSTFYRTKLTLFLQASGTPMHQGTLIAAAVPIGFAGPATTLHAMGTFMAASHVFLSANQATSAALEIPFYVNGTLEMTDTDLTTISPYSRNVNYAEVDIMVVNPLAASNTIPTAISISVHAMFNELEFYVPHVDPVTWITPTSFASEGFWSDVTSIASKGIDGLFSLGKKITGDLLDAGRRGIRALTGLHNPNCATIETKVATTRRQHANITDAAVQFEKLDPYANFDRVCMDYIFDTDTDEMALSHILRKPQYIGTFNVASSSAAGTLLWSRPITPFMQYFEGSGTDDDTGETFETTAYFNLLQNFARLSRYWKGSLKIHIQSNMSNFQFVKLAIARNYSTVTKALNSYPSFEDVPNLLTEYVEFSAGGQVQTITLPFCSALSQLPISSDWAFNALSHGIYYIYLNQPLVYASTGVNNCQFNVYVSAGDDFQFFGYATEPLAMNRYNPLASNPTFADDGDDPTAPEFSAEASTGENLSEQNDLLNNRAISASDDVMPMGDLRPITHVRDYIRRMYRVYTNKFVNKDIGPVIMFDVARLLGVRNDKITNGTSQTRCVTTLDLIQSMFLGYAGGARFKIMLGGVTNAMAYYLPPGYRLYRESTGSTLVYWVGADPNGPLTNTVVSADLKNITNEPYRYYDEVGLPPKLHTKYLANTVLQERPNYTVNASNMVTNLAGGSTGEEEVCHTNCMLEVEVPNISPYRFVGDISKINGALNSALMNTPTTNMGHIAIVIPSPYITAPGSTQDKLAIEIDIFASANDTARLGYQVFCPVSYLPSIKDGTGKYVQFSTQSQPGPTSALPLPYAKVYGNIAPYYTKT
jgi:hypothetical protein